MSHPVDVAEVICGRWNFVKQTDVWRVTEASEVTTLRRYTNLFIIIIINAEPQRIDV